jgi:hypothetical protein
LRFVSADVRNFPYGPGARAACARRRGREPVNEMLADRLDAEQPADPRAAPRRPRSGPGARTNFTRRPARSLRWSSASRWIVWPSGISASGGTRCSCLRQCDDCDRGSMRDSLSRLSRCRAVTRVTFRDGDEGGGAVLDEARASDLRASYLSHFSLTLY